MANEHGWVWAGAMLSLSMVTTVTHAQPPPPPPAAPAPYPTYEPPSYAPVPAPAPATAVAPATSYGPPPPPPRPRAPRVVYGWDPDVPPPDGYELDSDANMGLIGTGIGLFASGYFTSVMVAVVATQVDEVRPGTESDWSPLYVPVAGPFVALGTLDPSAAGVGLLLADGLFQAAGVLGIVLGIVDQEYKLIHTGDIDITPTLMPGQQGLMMRGAF